MISVKVQKKRSAGGAHRCANPVKRTVCALLTAILVAAGFPVQFYENLLDFGKVEAAEGTQVTKTYILETTTGINDGAQIEFFEIRYTDTGNVKRRQYIFPNEDSLMLGRIQAAKYGTDKTVLDAVNDNLKYATNNAWDKKGDGSGLRQYHTDQFYFTTQWEVSMLLWVTRVPGPVRDSDCSGWMKCMVCGWQAYGLTHGTLILPGI